MTMNESQFAARIKGYLDHSSAGLKAGTAYRLQQARAEALARLAEPQHAAELTLAGAQRGAGTLRHFAAGQRTHRFWASWKLWAGILAIVVASASYQQWHSAQQIRELEETDAAILSSDLPIDAYLDRGFNNWLKLGAE
jgi:hypothetical protein